MSRIFISCVVLLFCVFSSCLATSPNIGEMPEHAQSELDIPYAGIRQKRSTIGTEVILEECAHLGRVCSIRRDRTDNPKKVTYVPCCEHLFCAGIGPNERRNPFGQAVSSDELYSTGICSLTLDNDQGAKDQVDYSTYVKEL